MSANSPSINGASKGSVLVGAEEAIRAFKRGEMLILTDDEDRENEGDFVIAAEFASAKAVNFMVTHGRGLVCVAITAERAAALDLQAQVQQNTALLGTGFTVSVDAVKGTTSGTSVHDRALTIGKLIDPDAVPADLGRPGHIFPLISRPGGVLERPGHTEATTDLAIAAGLTPAGVLCEVLNADGSMARQPELIKIARQFKLKMSSVRELVEYRRRTELNIEVAATVDIPTEYGDFVLHLYKSRINPEEQHIALVKGDISAPGPLLVRVHSECFTGDILGSMRCDCGPQLEEAKRRIAKEGRGIIIYLRQEGRGIGLENKLRAYQLQEDGHDTVEANEALGFKADLREYWFAAQILRDLGATRVNLMTNNPRKVNDLGKYGIVVEERHSIVVGPNPANEKYLRTKSEKLGHLIAADIGKR